MKLADRPTRCGGAATRLSPNCSPRASRVRSVSAHCGPANATASHSRGERTSGPGRRSAPRDLFRRRGAGVHGGARDASRAFPACGRRLPSRAQVSSGGACQMSTRSDAETHSTSAGANDAGASRRLFGRSGFCLIWPSRCRSRRSGNPPWRTTSTRRYWTCGERAASRRGRRCHA